MNHPRILVRCVWAALLVGALSGADWPAFRGPSANGHSNAKGVPTRWSETENVLWKTELPGPGGSSPIVSGDRVFVTCFTGEKAESLQRHLLCIDRKSGNVVWKKSVKATLPENDYSAQLKQHGFTTSTPTTDGKSVFVFYGRTGLLAYDFDGNQLWHTELGKYVNGFGSGSSPVLYKDLIIVNATVESRSLVAVNKKTGKIVWKKRLTGDVWGTPILVDTDDKQEMVINDQGFILGFDPTTGEELWKCAFNIADYVSSTPVTKDGIVYTMGSGSNGREFVAVRAGGKGDVSKTHVLWRISEGASFCSPILIDDRLYFFSGGAICINAKNGEVIYKERLRGLGREYVSPVAIGTTIYVPTRYGPMHLVEAGDKFKVSASNRIEDSNIIASPAISDGCLFLRSDTHLYCIGTNAEK